MTKGLYVVPLTLKQLNEFVKLHHRHHKPVVGHRFSLGVEKDGKLVGACSVGRPVARGVDYKKVAEVTRLVTDGTFNACSILYGAAARACKAMGYHMIQTYVLESECGASLKASNYVFDGETRGGSWFSENRPREDKHPICKKHRYVRMLTDVREG